MSTTPTSVTPGSDGQNPRVMPAEMADADRPADPHRSPPDDGDAGLVGRREERVAIEDQRLAGVDRQHLRAGDAHRLDGRKADDRHVESHVLVGLGDLDDATPAPAS